MSWRMGNSQIVRGRTWHCRYQPRRHAFEYRMVWLRIDLAELSALDRDVKCFGHNRRSIVSIHDSDYAGTGHGSIRDKLATLLAREGMSDLIGRIELITLPRVLGYAFNPVSFFLCSRTDGSLAALVAEVHNTFGETHHYFLKVAPCHGEPASLIRFRFPKSFYVSPFNQVDGEYELRLERGGDSFALHIDLWKQGQLAFSSGMAGDGVPLNTRGVMSLAIRLPFIIASVMPRITWQALQLYILKQIPIFEKPSPSSSATIPAGRSSVWYRGREYIVRLAAGRASKPQGAASVCAPTKGSSV